MDSVSAVLQYLLAQWVHKFHSGLSLQQLYWQPDSLPMTILDDAHPEQSEPSLCAVCNQPLVYFAVRTLEEAGVREAVLVCVGESSSKVAHWAKSYTGKVRLQTISVPEGKDTADALRAALDHLDYETLVVISGDLVTDLQLQAVLGEHFVNDASLTVVCSHKPLQAADAKPGKARKNVDYIGLGQDGKQLLLLDSSQEAKRTLRIPPAVLSKAPSLTISAGLADAHLYVLQKTAVQDALAQRPGAASLKHDLLPYMVRHQHDPVARSSAETDSSGSLQASAAASDADTPHPTQQASVASTVQAGDGGQAEHRVIPELEAQWRCQVHIAEPDTFCARANSLASFAEINREVAVPERAEHLLGATPDRSGATVADGVSIGQRASIGTGCVVARGAQIGDRASIKRSVLGKCQIGAGAKVVNSVVLDNAVLGQLTVVQNCIVCAGAQLQDRCNLRDCQVGPDYVVSEGAEYRGEALAAGGLK